MDIKNVLKKGECIHFIGIGGVSMSALAKILIKDGYKISGSDINHSDEVKILESQGMKFYLGHSGENIKDAAAVIYTMAVHEDNPEIVAAKEKNIPVIRRAELLGAIMDGYKYSVAVAGTHGKTTVTSMLTYIFEETHADPTVLVGARLDKIGGNLKIGGSEYFLAEACEYHRSFLDFNPYCEVILNVEPDHLDYYKDADDYHSAYVDFLKKLKPGGIAVLCADDGDLMKLADDVKEEIKTFGIKNNADFTAENITVDTYGTKYDLIYKGNKLCEVSLKVFGSHNILNSLAAISTAYLMGIDAAAAAEALSAFTGAGRRFEYRGEINGARVYDDYAHHPTEISATLSAVSEIPHARTICVFQPHTYSRTKTFFDDFAKILSKTDILVLADIYAARESDDGTVSSQLLCDEIRAKYGSEAYYMDNFEKIAGFIKNTAQKDDIVIIMGAGDIVNLTKDII